jgi:hypothetical protein
LDYAVFAKADRFGHLFAFFLPDGSLLLGALTGFREALGSLIS